MVVKPHDREYREPENIADFSDNFVCGDWLIWINSTLILFISLYFIGLEFY